MGRTVDTDTISVIVPVFNTEKFLPRCLDSLLRQTYGAAEIILVDDGSSDDSLRICEKYARQDRRIKVISRQHGGVSSARNAGIQSSAGRYLVFVDSDDYFENDLLRRLHDAVADVDLVVCGCIIHDMSISPDMGKNIRATISPPECVLSVAEIARGYWDKFDEKWFNSIGNKLYRAAIVKDNNVLFPLNVPMGEDNNFNALYLLSSRAVRMIAAPLYHYLRHPKQSSKRFLENYFEAMTANFTMIERLIERHHGFEDKTCRERHLYEFFHLLKQAFYHLASAPDLTGREKSLKITACLNDCRSRQVIATVNVTKALDRAVLFLMKGNQPRAILWLFSILSLRLKLLRR